MQFDQLKHREFITLLGGAVASAESRFGPELHSCALTDSCQTDTALFSQL